MHQCATSGMGDGCAKGHVSVRQEAMGRTESCAANIERNRPTTASVADTAVAMDDDMDN